MQDPCIRSGDRLVPRFGDLPAARGAHWQPPKPRAEAAKPEGLSCRRAGERFRAALLAAGAGPPVWAGAAASGELEPVRLEGGQGPCRL